MTLFIPASAAGGPTSLRVVGVTLLCTLRRAGTGGRTDLGTLPVKTVPVVLPPAPASLSVQSSVTPTTLRLVGPPAVLAGINSVTVALTYRPGTFQVTPTFSLPAGVQALDSVLVNLRVTVKPKP